MLENFRKKIIFYFFILLVAGNFLFAKSKKEPNWFKNSKNVFPKSEYISQLGSGKTEEEAKTDALEQLSQYFKTTVNSNLSTSIKAFSTENSSQKSSSIINNVEIKSEVDFFGVQFTESYYLKKEKKYYIVVYIKRADAWNQYKPKIEAQKTEFYEFYNKAQNESDSFFKIGFLRNAENSSIEFLKKLEYARILSPKEEEKYSVDRKTISKIPSLIEQEKKNITIFVFISGDYANIIENAVKKSFEKNGFLVSKNAKYKANVKVFANESGSEPICIFPSVELTISDNNENPVFSYETNIQERTVAYTLENAKRKAFPKLAEKINQELIF